MSERRAVRVSFELWEQQVRQGYTTAGFRCIQGLPEDAALCGAWLYGRYDKPDPVFMFESENWSTPPRDETLTFDGQVYPVEVPVFRIAECRTCKWWLEGEKLTDPNLCEETGGYADADYGCVYYEPRETLL
jgi:hypothetical protein